MNGRMAGAQAAMIATWSSTEAASQSGYAHHLMEAVLVVPHANFRGLWVYVRFVVVSH